MRRLGLLIVLALMATACEKGGGVAVVNMESVARALGRDATIEQQIDTRTQELQGQLQQVAKQIGEKLEAEVVKTPDQRAQLQQQAQVAFQQQQQQAQQVLAQYRVKLATDFRNEVKTAAQKIAEERQFSVVVVDQVAVYYKDTQDITDDVTKAMRGGSAAPAGDAASPAPAAGG
jgi:Skp family chaperone for outer membrane proteins